MVFAVAAIVAAACSPTPSEESTDGLQPAADCLPGSARTVVVATDERPEDLHPFREGPRIGEWISQGLFEGLWGVDENHEFVPELLAEEATFDIHTDESVTVNLTLRSGLTWSDGTPLTSEHVEGTWRLIMERRGADGDFVLDFGPRTGYELIHPDSWKHSEDGRDFSFLLTEPFGGIRNLFNLVLPVHMLDSAGAANLALASGRAGIEVLPSSGPLVLQRFGDAGPIELVRNERYHGTAMAEAGNPGPACVTGVEVRFSSNPARMAEQLLDGTVDLVVATASRELAELLVANPDVTVDSINSLAVEHWGFNLHNEHLVDPNVRQAIAAAIDKQAVVDGVYAPIHGSAAPPVLGNFFLAPSQTGYIDHQADLGMGEPEVSAALLREAGYGQDEQGRWGHPQRGPLRLRVATTPDPVRQSQFELIRRQLDAAGIVVTLEEDDAILDELVFSEAALLCSREGTSGVEGDIDEDDTPATSDCGLWDIAQFTWTFASPWPGGQIAHFTSGSTLNPYGVADDEVDQLAISCIRDMDELSAADCFNRLDQQLLGSDGQPGTVVVPLAQCSTFVAWRGATLVSVPRASDVQGAGLFAQASRIVASGAEVSPTSTTSP